MLRVAITGGEGFLGTHMRFFLYEKKDTYEVVLIEKSDFDNDGLLKTKLDGVDTVLHFAGLNRGSEEEIYRVNTELTNKILNACDGLNSRPKILFVSSTHNTRDTAYGRSKRDSEKMILDWGLKNKVSTTSVVSSNIFGEFGKPNYNSFVSTFCFNIVSNIESEVNKDAVVNLVYVRDVCNFFYDLIQKDVMEESYVISGVPIKILDVYNKLVLFKDEYLSGTIPKIESKFDLNLFNTFRSYLYPKHFPILLDLKTDNRGSFVEVVKERSGGQSSFSTTHPGITRGNHYHTRKVERFCVLSGEASIKLRRIFTDEIIDYKVSGDKPVYVDMPTFYTHSIENIGNTELLTMFWINEFYDPSDPDTFMENVII
jgi:UDP-2-acetamido-2,6-beta-L-arabino-hexul-4-ose reductase